jgi:hypothetical protein
VAHPIRAMSGDEIESEAPLATVLAADELLTEIQLRKPAARGGGASARCRPGRLGLRASYVPAAIKRASERAGGATAKK